MSYTTLFQDTEVYNSTCSWWCLSSGSSPVRKSIQRCKRMFNSM